MNLKDEMHDMDLPLVNLNENLETISSQKFKLLFDVSKFEIRLESERDKGVDFNIEIKKSNKYTNFRCVVQLKATETIQVNNDGSYSLSIETSNINYLLQSSLPAFYVLYVKSSDVFYFENINVFIRSIYEKNLELTSQLSHTLRFIKKLNTQSLEDIYNIILTRGRFQRKINESIALRNAALSSNDKVSFDINLNINSDSEIRSTIEEYGILLDNEGRWSEIIKLHKQGSGLIASTAKYNLFVGIAYFHTGNLSEAMSSFKAATKLKHELSEQLQNHLQFFELTNKYSIGNLTESEYLKLITELETHPSIGLYIKLDKAKRKYLESESLTSEERHINLFNEIQSIIEDPKANENIILTARCELALYEGYKNNIKYVRDISRLNELEEQVGVDLNMRVNTAKSYSKLYLAWHENIQALKLTAFNSKNLFNYYHAILNEIKINYEFFVYSNSIRVLKGRQNSQQTEEHEGKDIFVVYLKTLEEVYQYYTHIDHAMNKAATLALRYEITHYINNMPESELIFLELENFINNYDLVELKSRFEYLKANGPMHVQFEKWLINIFDKRKKFNETSNEQSDEMTKMDNEEILIKKSQDNCYQIDLFPIGRFQFPKDKLDVVYEILNINTEDTKLQFNKFFATDNIVPIANIYNSPIINEGPLNGMAAERENGWTNLYRIRKSFYENKFYRIS